ncbi:hypothetical protein Btru_036993 [Bulinus truncatus]|nr:hypothetical protein Btru_036993 [Bulinus truncatus]
MEENVVSGNFHHNDNKTSSCVELSSTPTSPLSRIRLPVSPTATIASGTDSEVYMDTLSDFDTHQPEKFSEQKEMGPSSKKSTSFGLPDDIQSAAKPNNGETSYVNIPFETSESEFSQAQSLSSNNNSQDKNVKDTGKIDLILKTNLPSRDVGSSEAPQLPEGGISLAVEGETLPDQGHAIHEDLTDELAKNQNVENTLLKITPAVVQDADSRSGQISQDTSTNISLEINNHLPVEENTAVDVNDGSLADASETFSPTVAVQGQTDKATNPVVIINASSTGKKSSHDSKVDSDELNSSSNCYNSSTSNEQDAMYELLINEKDSTVLSDESERERPSTVQHSSSPPLISGGQIATPCQVHKEDAGLILNESHQVSDASLEVPLSCEDTQSSLEYGSGIYEGSNLSIADVDKISASRDRLIFEVQYSDNSEGDIISPVSDLSRLSPVQELTGDDSLSISPLDVQLRSHSTASDSRGSSQASQLNAILLNCGLREVLVYAQGHSDTLLVLLLSRSAKCGKSYINSLWKSCLSHLAELDFEVKDAERHLKDEAENIGSSFQYIKYDSFTQSLKGSALLPVTSLANEIVDSSVKMHESFGDMPELQEITYRSHSASCFGRRSINSETYFQLGLSPSAAGICSPDDKTFSLEPIAEKVLQKEAKISML